MNKDKENRIREYLKEASEQPSELDCSDLIGSCLKDSVQIVNFVTFLEDEFQVDFDQHDIGVENFRSLDAVMALLERKQR